MRNTFFYFDFSQLTEEQLAAYQEARSGGSISIDFTAPAAYSGSVPSIETQPFSRVNVQATSIDDTPQYAGYTDVPLITAPVIDGVVGEYDLCTLRLEQHPAVYGTPIRFKFRNQLSDGTVPADNQVLTSTPVLSGTEYVVEVAMVFSQTSQISQSAIVTAINNIRYENDYFAIASIGCVSNSPIIAVRDTAEYIADAEAFHDLTTDPKDYVTTAGDASILLVSGDPLISGTPEQGRLLSINLTDVIDIDVSIPVSYQWYREVYQNGQWENVAIDGATSIFYTVKSTDVEKNLTAGILYISTSGDITQKYTQPIEIINSLPSAEISISTSTNEVGSIVVSNVQNVQDANYFDKIEAYQWQRSQDKPLILNSPWQPIFSDIAQANSASYQITEGDQGSELRLKIEVSDNLGDIQPLYSNRIGPVNSEPVGNVYISGTATVGSTLYAIKNFNDADVNPDHWAAKVQYQWLRNGYAIDGATGNIEENEYIVSSEDYNNIISVRATYTDARGKTHILTSVGVTVISNNVQGFTISGTREVEETLTAEIDNVLDNDLVGERVYTDSNGDTVTVENGRLFSENVEYKWSLVNDTISSTSDIEIDSDGNYIIPSMYSLYKYDTYGVFKEYHSNVNRPSSLLIKDDFLYFSEPLNHRIRYIDMTSSNLVTDTFVGSGQKGFSGDGSGSLLIDMDGPRGFVFDSLGRMYIADSNNRRIRRVDTDGIVSTYAGNPEVTSSNYTTTYLPDYYGNNVNATEAKFALPYDLDFDSSGNLYVADRDNHIIRKIDSSGIITDFAGVAEQSGSSTEGSNALSFKLSSPEGVTFDSSDNLYIADYGNNRIVKIDAATQNATTFASMQNVKKVYIKDGNLYAAASSFVYSLDSQGSASVVYGFEEQEEELVPWGTTSSFYVEKEYYNKVIKGEIKYTDSYDVEKVASSESRIQNSQPTGDLVLSGTLGAGLPLTLYVDGVLDRNAPSSSAENSSWLFNYKFRVRPRNPLGGFGEYQNIEGESGSINGNETYTYTVDSSYYGASITALVDYLDGRGEKHTLAKSVSMPSLGLPRIIGTNEQGYVLSASLSNIENLPPEYAGQAEPNIGSVIWYRAASTASNLEVIENATEYQYEVTAEDVGSYITFKAAYLTNVGEIEERYADAIFVVNSIPTSPTIQPSSSLYAGGYAVGETLFANTSSVTDRNGVDEIYNIQWYRQENAHSGRTTAGQEDYTSVDIVNATGSSYTITTDDQAKRIGYRANLRDNLGEVHEIDSGYSYRRVDYDATGTFTISGQPKIGETLSLSPNINDLDEYYIWPSSFYFRWYVDDNLVSGENLYEYVIRYGDYNKTIRAEGQYNDLANGDLRIFSSSNSVYVTQAAGSGFFVEGNPRIGGTLEAITTFIDDPEGTNNSTFNIEWFADNVTTNVTASSYLVESDDYGKTIKAVVTYTDDLGNQETQEASKVIINSAPTGTPKLLSVPDPLDTGSAPSLEEGGFLSVSVDNLLDAEGPSTLAEQESWLFTRTFLWKGPRPADDQEIAADQSPSQGQYDYTYQIQADDLGKDIYVKVEFTDGKGNLETVYSNIISIPAAEVIQEVTTVENSVPPESFGTGENVVSLASDYYEIIYDSSEENPSVDYITLTAEASSETSISYEFFEVNNGNNIVLQKEFWDQENTRLVSIPSTKSGTSRTFGVKIYDLDGIVLSADYIVIYFI